MHIKFCSENVNGSDHSEDMGIHEKIILDWIRNYDGHVCIRFIWLRIGTNGRLL
jgi:hypothetical protein